MTGNDVLVGPMREVELRRAIERPAQRVGVTFEPGLVELMVADVAGRAGALRCCRRHWPRRGSGERPHADAAGYREAGGVERRPGRASPRTPTWPLRRSRRRRAGCSSASARRATTALDVRRRLPLAELAADDARRLAVAALVDRRLLMVDRDTVEVAHEALLREWPRLRAWLDEDVQGRRLHRRSRATRPEVAGGEDDPSELYRGTSSTRPSTGRPPIPPTSTPRNRRSSTPAQRGGTGAEHARRAADKARNNRRLRSLLAGVAALLVVAIVAGLLFVRQRDRAEGAAEARARALASDVAIDEDPELAILLGLAAAERTDEPSSELLSALHRATQSTQLTSRIDGVMNMSMDQSPDGSLLAVDRLDRTGYLIIETSSGETVADVTTDYEISDLGLVFDPTGSTLAVAYGVPEDESAPAVEIFDVATSQPVRSLTGPSGYYCCSLQYDPTGRWLGALQIDANDQASAMVWDVAAGGSPRVFGPAYDFELGRDGTSIVVGRRLGAERSSTSATGHTDP